MSFVTIREMRGVSRLAPAVNPVFTIRGIRGGLSCLCSPSLYDQHEENCRWRKKKKSKAAFSVEAVKIQRSFLVNPTLSVRLDSNIITLCVVAFIQYVSSPPPLSFLPPDPLLRPPGWCWSCTDDSDGAGSCEPAQRQQGRPPSLLTLDLTLGQCKWCKGNLDPVWYKLRLNVRWWLVLYYLKKMAGFRRVHRYYYIKFKLVTFKTSTLITLG